MGAARENNDPTVIAASMAKPGVVLNRPVGSDGPFGEHAALPTGLGAGKKKEGRFCPEALKTETCSRCSGRQRGET